MFSWCRVETGVLVLAEAGRSDEGDSVAIVEQTYVMVVTLRSVVKVGGTGGTTQIQGVILHALQLEKNTTAEKSAKSPSGFKLAIV